MEWHVASVLKNDGPTQLPAATPRMPPAALIPVLLVALASALAAEGKLAPAVPERFVVDEVVETLASGSIANLFPAAGLPAGAVVRRVGHRHAYDFGAQRLMGQTSEYAHDGVGDASTAVLAAVVVHVLHADRQYVHEADAPPMCIVQETPAHVFDAARSGWSHDGWTYLGEREASVDGATVTADVWESPRDRSQFAADATSGRPLATVRMDPPTRTTFHNFTTDAAVVGAAVAIPDDANCEAGMAGVFHHIDGLTAEEKEANEKRGMRVASGTKFGSPDSAVAALADPDSEHADSGRNTGGLDGAVAHDDEHWALGQQTAAPPAPPASTDHHFEAYDVSGVFDVAADDAADAGNEDHPDTHERVLSEDALGDELGHEDDDDVPGMMDDLYSPDTFPDGDDQLYAGGVDDIDDLVDETWSHDEL